MTRSIDVSIVAFSSTPGAAVERSDRFSTEILVCQTTPATLASPQDENTVQVTLPALAAPSVCKNIAWRSARGRWVLFLLPGTKPPAIDPLISATDVDVITPPTTFSAGGWPLLHPPFAIRRHVLEDIGGFDDVPHDLEDLDLGIRLMLSGMTFSHLDAWAASDLPRRPLTFEDVLALFYRHPYRWILRWACDQVDPASEDRDEELEARFARLFRRPVPARCLYSAQDIADIIACRATPPLLEPADVDEALDRAVAAGFYTSGTAEAPRFDRGHAVNWVYSNSRYNEGALSRAGMLRHPPPRLLDPAASSIEVEAEGRYEIALDAGAMAGLEAPTLSLSLPAETAEQRDLQLYDFDPPELEHFVDRASATIRQFPLAVPRDGSVRLGYSFQCRTREGQITPSEPPAPCTPSPMAPRFREALNAVLTSIFERGRPPADPAEAARAIYCWLIDHIEGLLSDRMGLFALEARGGHCVHRTRLYALLCEGVGLPVRSRSGLMAGPVNETGSSDRGDFMTTGDGSRGHPLNHIWPEVYLAGRGWCPLDFVASPGRRILTPRPVRHPQLCQRIREWLPLLERYYFGATDPYRIYFAAVPGGLDGIPTGQSSKADLDMIWRVAWGTRHSLELTFRDLPPGMSGTLPRPPEGVC